MSTLFFFKKKKEICDWVSGFVEHVFSSQLYEWITLSVTWHWAQFMKLSLIYACRWVWMLLVLYAWHVFTGIEQNNTTKHRKKKNEKKRKVVATKIRSKYIHPTYFMDLKISVLEIVRRGGLQSYEAHT